MSDGDYGDQSFEEKVRAIFKEVSQSIEQAAESIDLDEIADRLGVSSDRFRYFAETAGQWLSDQFAEHDEHDQHGHDDDVAGGVPDPDFFNVKQQASEGAKARRAEPQDRPSRRGPHPRDVPTEEQGLALSALESGRWKVAPGTNELSSDGEGPDPRDAAGLVGELRARDWIAADGEITLVGRDALRRWLESTSTAQ
jgi:hypothetical protein